MHWMALLQRPLLNDDERCQLCVRVRIRIDNRRWCCVVAEKWFFKVHPWQYSPIYYTDPIRDLWNWFRKMWASHWTWDLSGQAGRMGLTYESVDKCDTRYVMFTREYYFCGCRIYYPGKGEVVDESYCSRGFLIVNLALLSSARWDLWYFSELVCRLIESNRENK